MKRIGPLLQMTLALVALCGTLVMLADLFFGVLPDRAAQTRQLRKDVAEALAVQVAALLQDNDLRVLERTLQGVAARTEGVLSLAVRRADDTIVMQAGDHQRAWRGIEGEQSQLEQVTVPLSAAGQRWGTFEIAFRGNQDPLLWRWLTEPLVVTLLFIAAAGTLVFGLYMRRALQHLDPASVIPERVQGAFDAMAEGVVVLDARARVLLANKAFRGLHRDTAELRTGKSLSSLAWLAAGLPADVTAHPWTRAMSERTANAGHTLQVSLDSEPRQLVINCAPITDPGGGVRGCLATFNDVSELHRANEALREVLAALSASKDEVQRKNEELQLLATRDPLTGCLNRRSFREALDVMLRDAQASGSALSCLMLDIDHFKAVNDTHGHAIGDRVIQEVAKKLQECARATDLVCRYGGEEFCVVVPGMRLTGALAFAERVRDCIERECAVGVREVEGLRVTVSIGVDSLAGDVPGAPTLLDRADQALYRAKRGGRNRVCELALAGPAATSLDPLTACLAPAAFQQALEALLRDGQARMLAGVKLHVDTYRSLAAQQGFDAAQAAVRAVASVLQQLARPQDLVCRLDVEHFAVVAPGFDIQQALAFAERVRARVERDAADAGYGPGGLTISAGVDSLPVDALGARTVIERADQALARAKRDGRNRVHRFSHGRTANAASDHRGVAAAEDSPS